MNAHSSALAVALSSAGIQEPIHKVMRIKNKLTITFLVKDDGILKSTTEHAARNHNTKDSGRKVFTLQGNTKIGLSVIESFIPVNVTIVSGCGSNGDRLRVVFTMASREHTEVNKELCEMFDTFAGTCGDLFELYDNGNNGHLMQFRGQNNNNAKYFIEI